MTGEERREAIEFMAELYNPDALFMDGLDEAIIGFGGQFTHKVVTYSRQKIIDILMERDGMSEEEAVDYFAFNIEGAWVGENTPIIVDLL